MAVNLAIIGNNCQSTIGGGVANPTNTITRDATAWNAGGIAIANENDFYKAAYYQPVGAGGDTDSYWLYPTASNSITTADANYANVYEVGSLTDVGTYSDDASYYGTFDQGGNVSEWSETMYGTSLRLLRGGQFNSPTGELQSSFQNSTNQANENTGTGFRVTSLSPIPEPSTDALLFGIASLAMVARRRL